MSELKCHIVRDLLPLYIDGLTSNESSMEIEEHLQNCPDCRRVLSEMSRTLVPVTQEQKEEIDYLKKVKRGNHKKIILAVILVLALAVGFWGVQSFYLGEEADEHGLVWQCRDDGDCLYIYVDCAYSAQGYRGWQWEVRDGNAGQIIEINARRVTSSFLSSGYYHDTVVLDGVERVYLCGTLIWQEGLIIDPQVNTLYETKTPYIGDMLSSGRVAQALAIGERCGSFKNELHTSSEPYSWCFDFNEPLYDEWSENELNHRMENNSYFLIALIDNLSAVRWTYTDAAGDLQEKLITIEEINQTLPELTARYNERMQTAWTAKDSVKNYAASPKTLQMLYEIVK